jgi:hypothetical protein
VNAPSVADQLETFVGFWPTREDFGEIDEFELEHGVPTINSATQLRATLLLYSGRGWKMVVCADYLCLLHLDEFEGALAIGRQCEDIASPDLLRGTQAAWPAYIQALNAWYFLLFAACQTGRNSVFMHDFAELNFWNCTRVLYKESGEPVRHANYGRASDAYLRRFRRRIFDSSPSFLRIDHGIFDDAASYWGTISSRNLVSLAALGCKIVSEHRIRNHRAAVALAWFELEAWIINSIRLLEFQTTTRRGRERLIKDMIDDFPPGTSVANLRDDLHALREVRNRIAHQNVQATHSDSALALRCFVRMLNVVSGLALKIDENPAPTIGL